MRMLISSKISKSFFVKIFPNDTMVVFFVCPLSSPNNESKWDVIWCEYKPPKYDQKSVFVTSLLYMLLRFFYPFTDAIHSTLLHLFSIK